MKVAFFASDKPRERILADAVLTGAKRHGHQVEMVPLGQELEPGTYDVICMFGVKSNLRWKAHRAEGSTLIMFDKGYSRDGNTGASKKWEYFRFSVNDHHPTRFLMERDFPEDRWNALGLTIRPWRQQGEHIIIVGSSAKYHAFYDLPEPNEYAAKLAEQIRQKNNREIIYRPKPSWELARPIPGTIFSNRGPIDPALKDAWAIVTHGSNSCFEALMAGIPCVVLGNAIGRPISSTRLQDVKDPLMLEDPARLRLFSALAYHQFTNTEFATGMPWEIMQEEIYATA